MGTEPSTLLEKILLSGIFGLKQEDLTDQEILLFIESKCVEIVSEEDVQKRKYPYDLLEKNSVKILDFLSNSENLKIADLRNRLIGFFLRLNSYTWRQLLVGNNMKFHKGEFFFVLDELLQTKDFIDADFLRKKYCVKPKAWRVFFTNLKKNEIIDVKILNKSTFLRLRHNAGKVILHGFLQVDSQSKNEKVIQENDSRLYESISFVPDKPLYLQIQDMIYTENGTTSSEINEKFGLDIKFSLKILEAIKQNNRHIQSEDFSFGKITKYVFYVEDPDRPDLRAPDRITNDGCISREEKLNIFKKMAKDLGCFSASIENRRLFGRLLKSKYIPDRKNFIKIAKECDLKVKPYYAKGGKILLIAQNDDQFSEFKVSEPKKDESVEVISLADQKRLYNRFVMQREQVALDNGYLQNIHSKYQAFVNIYFEITKKLDYDRIDSKFISNIPLRDIFKLFMYPYIIRILQKTLLDKSTHILLIESKDDEHTNDNILKSTLSFADLEKMSLYNLDCTYIFHLYQMTNFEALIEEFQRENLLRFSNQGSFLEILLNQNINTISNHKSKRRVKHIPHVEIKERKKVFSEIIQKLDESGPKEIHKYFMTNYCQENQESIFYLIKTCFRGKKYRNFLICNRKEVRRSVENNTEIAKYYRDFKNKLLLHKKYEINKLNHIKEELLVRIIEMGQKDKFIKVTKFKKHVKLRNRIQSILNDINIDTYIVDNQFWKSNWNVRENEETLVFLGAKYIFKLLISLGSISFSNLIKRCRFLLLSDIEDILEAYADLFQKYIYKNEPYLSLKIPNVI